MTSLSDVHRCVLAKDTMFFGPLEVAIVNFVAPNPFPRKFVYRGCSHRTDKGVCKVSIEGPRPSLCKHEAKANGIVAWLYCFEMVLF
ncbi:unnamed protein product [Calypogeia fissa]